MLKGNKGEWSEFYTFIKILADKEIAGADENLEKIEDIIYPVLKVIREESHGALEYELQEDNKVKIIHDDGNSKIVDISDLKSKVVDIFDAIKNSTKTFSIPISTDLFDRFEVGALNAGNEKKEDLVLKIHDHTVGTDQNVGFSIKSKLGSPSTLLNASTATNFTFKITGLNNSDVESINGIDTKSKIKDRLANILSKGGKLHFHKVDSEVFERNLRMIDTIMPEIMSEILLAYYSDRGPTFPELLQSLNDDDIHVLDFDLSVEAYTYKIKSLLKNVALGMVPASPWDGILSAHGGVIVVREDGEIVCYHLYNADAFRNYLFNNTRLESPGSTRHGYGSIYEEDGEMFIKFNLQIRFNS